MNIRTDFSISKILVLLKDKNELREIIRTTTALFKADNDLEISDLLGASEVISEATNYDNWNGGTTYFAIFINVSVDQFVKVQSRQTDVEAKIKEKIEILLRGQDATQIDKICIIPKSIAKIEWDKISDLFNKNQLTAEINYLKDVMISVSTAGQTIQDVNPEYQKRFIKVNTALKRLGFENPNPFDDLWQWYGRWRSGEMPKYQDRREFIGKMYGDLLKLLQETEQSELLSVSINLTGWERIERTVLEIRMRVKQAKNEEQFQGVGLLCRETIISLAQAVFIEEKHPTLDGVKASKTDAKRMLDAYIAIELGGGTNENIRKYARASNDLANELTHKRTANSKDAALCASATVSLVNLIGILEDRH